MSARSREGQKRLIEDVIESGLCVNCGACVGLCPYFDYFDGKVVVLDRCQASTAKCLQVCPMADFEGTRSARKGTENGSIGPLGYYQYLTMAQGADTKIREQAQYGGVISTLLVFAMKTGQIEAALVTDHGSEFAPKGRIVETASEVISCAGSRYTGSGSMAVLNRAFKAGGGPLGIVGLPCQMEALARMRLAESEGEELDSRIAIKVGLFCTWAIEYRSLQVLLKGRGITGPPIKFDIPPPPSEVFQVQTQEGRHDFPLSQIRPIVQEGCMFCEDMTAQLADISVGMVEDSKGWNTVLVRTDDGERLIREAVEQGWLETQPLPQKNLDHLMEAANNKRNRAKEMKEKRRE